MNKTEMIKIVSKQTKLTKKDCLNCVNAITALIKESVRSGGSVNLKGFGSFNLKYRKQKLGFNPLTKKPCIVSARKVPSFKVAEVFKESVNS